MTNPESYSFAGAKWFSAADGYEGRKYDDFIDDGPLDKTVTGGWVAAAAPLLHRLDPAEGPGRALRPDHLRPGPRHPRDGPVVHARAGGEGGHQRAPVGRPEAGLAAGRAGRAGPGARGRLQPLPAVRGAPPGPVLGAGPARESCV